MKKTKFKDRYVLGVGFPEDAAAKTMIRLWTKTSGGIVVLLKYPYELREEIVPKYRLVLERVK